MQQNILTVIFPASTIGIGRVLLNGEPVENNHGLSEDELFGMLKIMNDPFTYKGSNGLEYVRKGMKMEKGYLKFEYEISNPNQSNP